VHGFEWDPTFVGKSFEQIHIQCTQNPAWIESMTCTTAQWQTPSKLHRPGLEGNRWQLEK